MRDASGLSGTRISRAKIFSSAVLGYDSEGWYTQATRFGDGSRTNSDKSTAGVDAFIALQKVTWVLSSVLGGITGNDDRIEVYTHRNDPGAEPGGAAWTQTPRVNPVTFTISVHDLGNDSQGRARTNGAAPDVIAHEAGHGLNYAECGHSLHG